MSGSFTFLEWPILDPSGVPEAQAPVSVLPSKDSPFISALPTPVEPVFVEAPRVAVPIEIAADDPQYAMLFPRQKRPTSAERS